VTTPAGTFTITRRVIDWYPAGTMIWPLGRNVHHDSRSLAYPWQPARGQPLASAEHPRHAPIFNQGTVGSCTGEAEEGCLSCDPLFAALPPGTVPDQPGALALYSAAETIDGDGPYPPNDNGSSGLSVCKAAMAAGLISGILHCFSLADVQDTLQVQPLITGINWYDSFDHPSADGLIAISPGASVRGGHEVVLRRLDVGRQLIGGDNSWGPGWGAAGSFWIGWADYERLLSEQGDATVPVPLTQPPPVPVPVPPAPPAPPGPLADPADRALDRAITAWRHAKHL
jgi:hypothetical protein